MNHHWFLQVKKITLSEKQSIKLNNIKFHLLEHIDALELLELCWLIINALYFTYYLCTILF